MILLKQILVATDFSDAVGRGAGVRPRARAHLRRVAAPAARHGEPVPAPVPAIRTR